MMAKIKPMPMRQHALFRRLMVLLMTALLEDMQNGTDNHTLFYEGSMAACLAKWYPTRASRSRDCTVGGIGANG